MLVFPSVTVVVFGTAIIMMLAALSVKVRALDIPGAMTGGLISFATLLAGGFAWLAIIITFVLISSLLTRYRYEYKRKIGSAQEKGGRRSWQNALANGLVGGVLALAEIQTHKDIFAVAYLASIAAAMSDTIATEIGLLSKSTPRLIFNLRKIVPPGTSGGVTGLGELAGLMSALGLCGLGAGIGVVLGNSAAVGISFVSAVFAAFVAMNMDSLLGATLQGRNKCKSCGLLTEELYHHGEPTMPETGLRFLDNNAVNLVTTTIAGLTAAAFFLVFVP